MRCARRPLRLLPRRTPNRAATSNGPPRVNSTVPGMMPAPMSSALRQRAPRRAVRSPIDFPKASITETVPQDDPPAPLIIRGKNRDGDQTGKCFIAYRTMLMEAVVALATTGMGEEGHE